MISEGLCDIEDWSNDDGENSAVITGINGILKFIKIDLFLLYFILACKVIFAMERLLNNVK